MHVPKAAMHKNNCLIFGEYDVRLSRIALVIFAVSKSLSK